jgi:hypothetical protein
MLRRVLPSTLLLAVAVLAGAGGPVAAQDPCDGSSANPPATNARVTISGLPTTTGNDLGLAYARDGGGDIVPDSMRYEVDGPAGHVSLVPDRYFAASYTPNAAGSYTIGAHWREYACADYRAVYNDITATPATFTTIPGERPKTQVRTSRRPKTSNSPGDATLEAFLNCPSARNADATPTRLAIYYRFDGHPATHSSKHSVLTVKDGCRAGTGVPIRRVSGKRFRLEISRGLAAFEVTAPGRADVMIELSYGGKLLKSARGRFRPSATGEVVTRS